MIRPAVRSESSGRDVVWTGGGLYAKRKSLWSKDFCCPA